LVCDEFAIDPEAVEEPGAAPAGELEGDALDVEPIEGGLDVSPRVVPVREWRPSVLCGKTQSVLPVLGAIARGSSPGDILSF
jgi:hypothetical protein